MTLLFNILAIVLVYCAPYNIDIMTKFIVWPNRHDTLSQYWLKFKAEL